MKKRFLFAPLFIASCGDTNSNATDASDTCTLGNATTATAIASPSGCAVRTRDVTECNDSRIAQGLSGIWLKFSCRVTLEKVGDSVKATSDNQPDYASNYFAAGNACHEEYSGGITNPNRIVAGTIAATFPLVPDTTMLSMQRIVVVGMAINGVAIYSNTAAPGDDIFKEAMTFDRCGAHPQQRGQYHYHSEPFSISYDDANLIGVLRDGYPVYGRKDAGGIAPADLDSFGGHIGSTVDSDTPVYHYHLNEQASTASGTVGQKQWFLTKGTFRGTPGACTGC